MSSRRDVSSLTNLSKDQLVRLLAAYMQSETNLRTAIDLMADMIPRRKQRDIPWSLIEDKSEHIYEDPREESL